MNFNENTNEISETGSNPKLPGFTEENLDRHFGSGGKSEHSQDYPEYTKEQYAQRALELIRSPVGNGIEGYKSTRGKSKGSIVRYDTSTGDWVRGWATGIATMFKPADGASYFERKNEAETGSD